MGISSFEALSNVGEGHGEGLHSRKGILEIQDVGIAINPAELHHLRKEKQTRMFRHTPVGENTSKRCLLCIWCVQAVDSNR